MTNWKQLVEKNQAQTYVLPAGEGWTPLAKVAEQMGCSVEKARSSMLLLIKNGSAEIKPFDLWDNEQKKVIKVTCYREKKK